MKYHLSEDGEPRKCSAIERPCPLGASEAQHYPSKEKAREAYEISMAARLFSEAEEVAWLKLPKDKQITVLASYNRILAYIEGDHRTKDAWEGIKLRDTVAGELELKRRLKNSQHDYDSKMKLVAKAEAKPELYESAALPSKPSELTLRKNFLKPDEPTPPERKNELLDEQKMLAYYSALWDAKLIPEEHEAVAWMTSNGSHVVGQYVRGERLPNWGTTMEEVEPAYVEEQLTLFRSAMAKAPLLEEPVVIYRGTNLDAPLPKQITTPNSASLSFRVADGFHNGEDEEVMYQIKTRKLPSVVNMSAWSSGELEVMLPLGSYTEGETFIDVREQKWNPNLHFIELTHESCY